MMTHDEARARELGVFRGLVFLAAGYTIVFALIVAAAFLTTGGPL